MSGIKTITARLISTVLNEDFTVGMLLTDATARNNIAQIDPLEIDVLIERLEEVKSYVETARNERQQDARKLLQELIGEGTGFASIEELIAATGITGAAATVKTKPTSTKPNGNKSYEVVIVDSKKDERRTYNVINKKLPAALLKDEVYQTLVQKNKELLDIDNFLRAYSTDYREAYPINAKWNGIEFHLNSRGKMNAHGTQYFEEYKKKYPNGTEKDFKEVVLTAYKKV